MHIISHVNTNTNNKYFPYQSLLQELGTLLITHSAKIKHIRTTIHVRAQAISHYDCMHTITRTLASTILQSAPWKANRNKNWPEAFRTCWRIIFAGPSGSWRGEFVKSCWFKHSNASPLISSVKNLWAWSSGRLHVVLSHSKTFSLVHSFISTENHHPNSVSGKSNLANWLHELERLANSRKQCTGPTFQKSRNAFSWRLALNELPRLYLASVAKKFAKYTSSS